MLERKENVIKAQKAQVAKTRRLRQGYKDFLKTDSGKDYMSHLTNISRDYLQFAMREPDPYRKATLVDTAAGVMLALNKLTEMTKPARSGGKVGKRHSSAGPLEQTVDET